jgi:hypothetical protein
MRKKRILNKENIKKIKKKEDKLAKGKSCKYGKRKGSNKCRKTPKPKQKRLISDKAIRDFFGR